MHDYQTHATPQRQGIPWFVPLQPLSPPFHPNVAHAQQKDANAMYVAALWNFDQCLCVSSPFSAPDTFFNYNFTEQWTVNKIVVWSCENLALEVPLKGLEPPNLWLGFFFHFAVLPSAQAPICQSLCLSHLMKKFLRDVSVNFESLFFFLSFSLPSLSVLCV